MKDNKFKPALIIKTIEKVLLGIIAILTVIAVLQEIYSIYNNGKVQLADLLLLFIYIFSIILPSIIVKVK